MLEVFQLGGWGMYPTTIAGLVLLCAAVQYARHPDRRRLQIVRSLGRVTLLVSTLGFVTGVITSFLSIEQAPIHDVGTLAVVGVGESLTNLGLGLVLLTLAAIVTTVGVARSGSPTGTKGGELADPHGP